MTSSKVSGMTLPFGLHTSFELADLGMQFVERLEQQDCQLAVIDRFVVIISDGHDHLGEDGFQFLRDDSDLPLSHWRAEYLIFLIPVERYPPHLMESLQYIGHRFDVGLQSRIRRKHRSGGDQRAGYMQFGLRAGDVDSDILRVILDVHRASTGLS